MEQVLQWVWGTATVGGKGGRGKRSSKTPVAAKKRTGVCAGARGKKQPAACKPVRNLGKCVRDGLRKRFPKIVDNVLEQAETDLTAARMVFGFEMVKHEMKPLRKGARGCRSSLSEILLAEIAKKELAAETISVAVEVPSTEADLGANEEQEQQQKQVLRLALLAQDDRG